MLLQWVTENIKKSNFFILEYLITGSTVVLKAVTECLLVITILQKKVFCLPKVVKVKDHNVESLFKLKRPFSVIFECQDGSVV